jgi:hypothetical protein
MEKLLRAMILVPVITGVMQGIKQLLPQTALKFMWVITCVVGVIAAYGYNAAMEVTMNNALIIFGGVIAGLSAAGLYEAGKNVITALKPTPAV